MRLAPLAAALALALPGATRQELHAGVERAPAEVLRVVDGDTLVVLLDGEETTLRLESVDTEEKIAGRATHASTKPETVFGQETAVWARALFAGLGERPRVELAFPGGRARDRYGRLLCHVLLPDGRDFNLLLVEEGRSPYFDKYGYSRTLDAEFRAAEERARAAGIGIWDPATNRALTPGAPSAVRPYDRLLPWWEARATAIEEFRRRAARDPDGVLASDDAAGLRRALARGTGDPRLRVTVFTTIERFYEEDDGALTVLLHGGDRSSALRATVPAADRPAVEPVLRACTLEFHQNHLWVRGRVERGPRGLRLTGVAPGDWVVAEPAYREAPAPAPGEPR